MNANRIYAAQLGISATAHICTIWCARRDAKRIAALREGQKVLLAVVVRQHGTIAYLADKLENSGIEMSEFDQIALNDILHGEVQES